MVPSRLTLPPGFEPRRKWLWRILTLLLVMLFVAGGFCFWLLKLGGGDDASPGDQDILLAAETGSGVRVNDAENGFTALLAATGLVQVPGYDHASDWNWPTQGTPDGADPDADDVYQLFEDMQAGKAWDDALAVAVLERNRPALALIAESIARPKFQIPRRELTDSLSQLLTVRDAAAVLVLRAQALARGGQVSDAVESALDAFRLGHRLAGGGLLLEYLVGTAVEHTGLRAVRSLVPRLNADEVRRCLSELVRLRPDLEVLRSAVRAEYSFFVRCLDGVEAGTVRILDVSDVSVVETRRLPPGSDGAIESLNERVMTSRYFFKPFRTRRLVATSLRILLQELGKPYAKRTSGMSERCGVFFGQDRTASNGVGAWLAASKIGVLERSVGLADELELVVSATRVLLALRKFKLETGKLPESLAELVPRHLDAVPRDPLDGAPLRYSRAKLRVWSVGNDLVDTGGGELGADGEWSPSEIEEPTYLIE